MTNRDQLLLESMDNIEMQLELLGKLKLLICY